MNAASRCAALAAALVCAAGCASAPSDDRIGVSAPVGSEAAFGPVSDFLNHRCGTLDCHGQRQRNWVSWGCQGLRILDTDVSICSRAKGGRATTPEEHQATYRSLVGLEPVVMSEVVEQGGRQPELLTFIRKARGLEAHRGGKLIDPGDDQDECLTTWLEGRTNLTACSDAFAEPEFPASP